MLYQWVSKRGGLSTLPSPSGGIDFSGGADKKFRRESLARLNEFARELRTFQDVDMAGKCFSDATSSYVSHKTFCTCKS